MFPALISRFAGFVRSTYAARLEGDDGADDCAASHCLFLYSDDDLVICAPQGMSREVVALALAQHRDELASIDLSDIDPLPCGDSSDRCHWIILDTDDLEGC